MKTKRAITVVISLIIGFSIGLMTGVTLTSPGMSLRDAAGTIGRVDQYRNVRITQQDIELQNDLMEDEQRREAFINYLTYEYVNNLQVAEDVRLALASSQSAGNFRMSNAKNIEKLGQYSEFLDNARLRILEAMGALHAVGEEDKVAVHTILKDAGNALAQNTLRSRVLFDFMFGVETFFQTASPSEFPDLAYAHDRIFTDLVSENLIKGNQPTLNHLLTKDLLGDVERLDYYVDAEQLGYVDAEQLGLGYTDAEQLGVYLDAEQLSSIIFTDAEQLGSLFYNEEVLGMINLNAEQLGQMMRDAEQLGVRQWDAEQLGLIDAEQLGALFDSEQFGQIMRDSDQLQMQFWDAEQLGAFRDAADQLQLVVPF